MTMDKKDSMQWKDKLRGIPKTLRNKIEKLVNEHAESLANAFYEHMLSNPETKIFLTNQEVKTRLSFSMQAWLKQLFKSNLEQEAEKFKRTQKKVGDIHARINLPVHLVLRGAMILKNELYKYIADDEDFTQERLKAYYYCAWLIDYAMELMSAAYSHSHDRKMKAEESYRLFSAVMNSDTEREKQNKALLDWENDLLFKVTVGENIQFLPKIKESDFGLWFNHKGMHMFESEQKEIKLINKSMDKIDFIIKNELQNKEKIYFIKEIRKNIRVINLNIDELFNRQSKLESGRDDLTRLLSRKFLPVILNKEINYSINHKKPFAILGIDIDFFKTINDNYGHEAGDIVLNQLGALLSQSIRAGDYVFRVGGEEFLVILVDIKNIENAVRVANLIRERVAKEPFVTSKGTLNITCSIGVIMHDGHPDYMRMLNTVDEALYEAKSKGRNQVVVN